MLAARPVLCLTMFAVAIPGVPGTPLTQAPVSVSLILESSQQSLFNILLKCQPMLSLVLDRSRASIAAWGVAFTKLGNAVRL